MIEGLREDKPSSDLGSVRAVEPEVDSFSRCNMNSGEAAWWAALLALYVNGSKQCARLTCKSVVLRMVEFVVP